MRRVVAFVPAVLLAAAGFTAAQSSLRAESTVTYTTGKAIPLDLVAGPVKVATVKFTVGDDGSMKSTIREKMARMDPATQTMTHVSFDAENPKHEEWKINYSVEYLDANGKVVDRFTKADSYEGQAKTTTFDHITMKAVLPLVEKVRIKLQAEAD